MKRVLITACLLAFASVGLTTNVHAVKSNEQPFVRVSPSTRELDLGLAGAAGHHVVNQVLKLKVQSNCFHGPIMISSTELKGDIHGSIPPERIFVRSSATWGFVPLTKPVAVSKAQAGNHDIVLDMQVDTGFNEIAGEYRGRITVTIMPPV